MDDLLSFADALSRCPTEKRHVLLGNGFSRACRDDVFSYAALFDRADFAALSGFARQAFAALGTTDFESVMRALRHAATLVRLYDAAGSELSRRFEADAEGLKEVLVQAIAGSHPGLPSEISSASYAHCRQFLANFERIYTLNYDLLLYWALMQEELEPALSCDDGFRTPEEGPEDYVAWEPWKSFSQNIFFLHGALHIFDTGIELQKYTWVNTGIPLIEQIRTALDENKYPLFVAEGESEQKLERIRHSDYLTRALKSFANIGGSLVIHGFSFAGNDDHVIRRLEGNKVRFLAVGLHGDGTSESNRQIRERAEAVANARPSDRPLEVVFYDSQSADVW